MNTKPTLLFAVCMTAYAVSGIWGADMVLSETVSANAALFEQGDYRNGGEFYLRAGGITAVVAPKLSGRLMGIVPDGETNLLWVHEKPEIDLWGWKSYGGDKTWIGPQDAWNDVIVSESDNWPPPAEFDGNPYEVVRHDSRSVEMLSETVAKWNLRVRRVVSIETNGTVSVMSRLEKADETAPVVAPEGMRFTNWLVTQLPVAPYVDVLLCGQKRVVNGDGATNVFQLSYVTDNSVRVQTGEIPKGKTSVKAFFDADVMVIPVRHGGKLIVRQKPVSEVETTESERGQIYVTGRDSLLPGVNPYMEIEWSQSWPDSEQTVTFWYVTR